MFRRWRTSCTPPNSKLLGIATAMRGFCDEFAEQKRVDVDFARS